MLSIAGDSVRSEGYRAASALLIAESPISCSIAINLVCTNAFGHGEFFDYMTVAAKRRFTS